MESEGKTLLGKVILVAVLIIFGASLIAVIADAGYSKTTKTGVGGLSEYHAMTLTGFPSINTTATYTVTNSPAGTWKETDCPLTNFAVRNSTGSALTLTSDYTVDLAKGTYQLKNTVNTNTTFGLYGPRNVTYVTYDYCANEYISGWGGNVLNMVGGFLALLLFGAAIGVMYSIYKDVTE